MKLYGFKLLVACLVSSATLVVATPSIAAPVSAVGNTSIVKMEVFPPDVNLNTNRDRQKFIVVATRGDGVTLDVTKEATATVADGKLARLADFTLYPTADGSTTLNVAYAGHKAAVPVVVKDATADRAISFKFDVMPVFMRSG